MKTTILFLFFISSIFTTEVFSDQTETDINTTIQRNFELIATGDYAGAAKCYSKIDLDGFKEMMVAAAAKGIDKAKMEEIESVFGNGIDTLDKVKAMSGEAMIGRVLEYATKGNPMLKEVMSSMKVRVLGIVKSSETLGYAVAEISITVNGKNNTAFEIVPVIKSDLWKIGLKADFKKLAGSISTVLSK